MGIWNLTIWNPDILKVRFQKVRFQKVWFSNARAIVVSIGTNPTFKAELVPMELMETTAIAIAPNHKKFVFVKMAVICPDFKWLGFQISDHILNLDHLQPNLYSTIQNPD